MQVVRGGPAFAVSLVLSAIEPGFRSAAELGAWQLISPVNATGKVVVVSGLHEVQDEVRTCSICALGTICSLCRCLPCDTEPGVKLDKPSSTPGCHWLKAVSACSAVCSQCQAEQVLPAAQTYEEPTVLLAKRVTGEEEVPEGAVAVLTPDAPDVLSHVSVRARNMKVGKLCAILSPVAGLTCLRNEIPCLQVLFAICHEQEPLGEIEKLAGRTIALQTSAAGGVSWEVVEAAADAGSGAGQPSKAARRKLQVGQAARDAHMATSHPHQMAVLLPWSVCDACCCERQAGLTACSRPQVKVPKWCGQYVVGMDGYRDGVVGAKSKNLAGGTPSLQLSFSQPLLRPKTCWLDCRAAREAATCNKFAPICDCAIRDF